MEEKKSIHCTLTDHELAAKADQWIDELIASGGKSFTMQIPARPNADTDLIFAELNNRFKKLISNPQPGGVWVKAITRLPNSWHLKCARFIHTKTFLLDPGNWLKDNERAIQDVEWLDESGTAGREEHAVGFADWLNKNYHQCEITDLWKESARTSQGRYTTAQLYLLFKQQKEK